MASGFSGCDEGYFTIPDGSSGNPESRDTMELEVERSF